MLFLAKISFFSADDNYRLVKAKDAGEAYRKAHEWASKRGYAYITSPIVDILETIGEDSE